MWDQWQSWDYNLGVHAPGTGSFRFCWVMLISSARSSEIQLFFPDPGLGIVFTVDMTDNVIKAKI